jgi:phospholipase C
VTVEGEVNTEVMTEVPAPIGLGYRVPLLIVSPWTRGNIVVSEAFDHTSILQFLEVRFNVTCPNISPWRRAMTGDLLSAFDFENPNYDWPASSLPDTSDYVEEGDVECHTLPPPVVPEEQSMPLQEPGTRISRALPYEFQVKDTLTTGPDATFAVSVSNTGAAGAPFVLYDVINLTSVNPRQIAVEAGKAITDTVTVPTASASVATAEYHYALMGMNGFVRLFRGAVTSSGDASTDACSNANAVLTYDAAHDAVVLTLSNSLSGADVTFTVQDNAYGQLNGETRSVTVPAGSSVEQTIPTAISGNWYDLTATVSSSQCFERRFMGRMETGKDGISDPAMGAGLPGLWGTREQSAHPKLAPHLRDIKRVPSKLAAIDKDAQFYVEVSPQ